MTARPQHEPVRVFHAGGRYVVVMRSAAQPGFPGSRALSATEARGMLDDWLRGGSAEDLRRLARDLLGWLAVPPRSPEVDARLCEELSRELEDRDGRLVVLEVAPTVMVPPGLPEPTAEEERLGPEIKPKTWIEIVLVDEADQPVAGVSYEIVLPDGSRRRGSTDAAGKVRYEGIDPGTCEFSFIKLDQDAWEPA